MSRGAQLSVNGLTARYRLLDIRHGTALVAYYAAYAAAICVRVLVPDGFSGLSYTREGGPEGREKKRSTLLSIFVSLVTRLHSPPANLILRRGPVYLVRSLYTRQDLF